MPARHQLPRIAVRAASVSVADFSQEVYRAVRDAVMLYTAREDRVVYLTVNNFLPGRLAAESALAMYLAYDEVTVQIDDNVWWVRKAS